MDVMETQNLSRSAERLFVTQSALTQAVQRLEQYFGVQLFKRTKTGMTPTRSGMLFAEYARDILSQCDRLAECVKEAGAERKKTYLTVGASKSYGKHFVSFYIKPFGDLYPEINIEFIEDRSINLEKMLINNTLDVCLMPTPIESNLLSCTPLFYEEILVALPRAHPRNIPNYPQGKIKFPEIDLSELSDETFVIPKAGYKLHELCLGMCRMLGIKLHRIFEIESVDTIIGFVSNNKGLGFIPDTFVKHSWGHNLNSVNYYRIKNANNKRVFMMVYSGNRKLPYIAQKFIQTIAVTQKQATSSLSRACVYAEK